MMTTGVHLNGELSLQFAEKGMEKQFEVERKLTQTVMSDGIQVT